VGGIPADGVAVLKSIMKISTVTGGTADYDGVDCDLVTQIDMIMMESSVMWSTDMVSTMTELREIKSGVMYRLR
jgi:hypothetical protein